MIGEKAGGKREESLINQLIFKKYERAHYLKGISKGMNRAFEQRPGRSEAGSSVISWEGSSRQICGIEAAACFE